MNAMLEKEALFGRKKKEPTEMEKLLADQEKAIAELKQNSSFLDSQVRANEARVKTDMATGAANPQYRQPVHTQSAPLETPGEAKVRPVAQTQPTARTEQPRTQQPTAPEQPKPQKPADSLTQIPKSQTVSGPKKTPAPKPLKTPPKPKAAPKGKLGLLGGVLAAGGIGSAMKKQETDKLAFIEMREEMEKIAARYR